MQCETCGNEYDRAFTIVLDGQEHNFDSFECAIHALAPVCGHCGCRIIGHGVQQGKDIFCCASCAKHHGLTTLKDREAPALSASRKARNDDCVRQAAEQSFPASDPPAWASNRQ
jgi:hypothetical protein